MATALITGITGQDGSYLAEFLLDKESSPKSDEIVFNRCLVNQRCQIQYAVPVITFAVSRIRPRTGSGNSAAPAFNSLL